MLQPNPEGDCECSLILQLGLRKLSVPYASEGLCGTILISQESRVTSVCPVAFLRAQAALTICSD